MKKYFIEVHSCNAPNTPNRLTFVEAPQESSTEWIGPRRDDVNYFMVMTDCEFCFMFVGSTFAYVNFFSKRAYEAEKTAFKNCNLKQGTVIIQECGKKAFTNGEVEYYQLLDAGVDTKSKLGHEVYFIEQEENSFWAHQIKSMFVSGMHPDNHVLVNGEKHYVYSQFGVGGLLPTENTNFYIKDSRGNWCNWFEQESEINEQ
jgi:hypothetical protein